jgi:plastocyanin
VLRVAASTARALPRARRLAHWAVAACILATAIAPDVPLAWAADIYEVVQKNRMFRMKELEIARGEVLRFINADEFLHQIYVKSSDFSFESDEQAPGKNIEIKFPAGTFEVRCRIHPKMLLVVHAK